MEHFMIKLENVKKIYSDGRHNAFTGIVNFKDQYFLVFRNGTGHISFDGKIKILTSKDLEKWEHTAELCAPDGHDLRDPKIIKFQNRLLLYSGIRREISGQNFNQSQVHSSADGVCWKQERLTGIDENYWLWGLTAAQDRLYGAAYIRTHGGRFHCILYRSFNGSDWQRIYEFPVDANETALDMGEDGKLYALCRNESAPYKPELFVFTDPEHPENNKHFQLDSVLQGPMIKRLDGGCLIAGRRWDSVNEDCFWSKLDEHPRRLDLLWLDDNRRVNALYTLPSGGDCSYAAWAQLSAEEAVMSYYSSHEQRGEFTGKCASADIFIARLRYY